MAVMLTTSDQFLGTTLWASVVNDVYYSFDVYGCYLSQDSDALTTLVQLYAVGYTNTGSYHWDDNEASATFELYNEGNTAIEYKQVREPFVMGTVSTTSKWINFINASVKHNDNGKWEDRRWTCRHWYYPSKMVWDKMSAGISGFSYYISVPALEVSTIKVYMGTEYKNGKPYVFESGAGKKGSLYRYNGSSWQKGK